MAPPPESSVENELRLAVEEYRSGDLASAEARVKPLVKSHPERADVQLANGIVQIAKSELALGLQSLIACLQADPDNREALSWAAFTSLNLQQFRQAEVFARHLTQISPQNPRAHYLLANALRALNRIEEGLQAIDASLALNPDDPEVLVTKARLLKAWLMPALAADLYKRSMELRPTPAAGLELAQIHFRDSRPAEALEVLNQIAPLMPKHSRPYGLMAEANTLLRQFDDAEKQWGLATIYAANPVAMVQSRARAEIAAGRFETAEGLLMEQIAQGQDLSGTFSLLTTGRKMKPDDLPLIERMASLAPSEGDPSRRIELSYALGKSFDDLRDYERAIRHFDEANRECLELYGPRRAFDREQTRAFGDFLIELANPDRIRDLVPRGLESSLPLFVVGMMRSGTTLTESIVSAHPMVKGGGEQAFWTERVIEFIHQDKGGLTCNSELVAKFALDYLRLVDQNEDGIRYVVDKNPHNVELAAILHCVLPNAKFVHLKRHPVDNLLSIWMTPVSANVRFASDRDNLVFTYREHMRLVKRWHEVLPPDRFATFRYEDLTSEPETTIGSMLDYLELSHEPACFAPETNARWVLTPSVFQVRQPINKGSQARWKNYEPWLGSFAELLDDADCL